MKRKDRSAGQKKQKRRKIIRAEDDGNRSQEDELEYEVEEIRGKKVDGGIVLYLIKWVGYSDEECSWESEENANCPALIREYEERAGREAAAIACSGSMIAETDQSDGPSERVAEEFEVEAIRAKRKGTGGTIQYLIKWKGYPEAECTWEDASNANCADLILQFEASLRAKPVVPSKRGADEQLNIDTAREEPVGVVAPPITHQRPDPPQAEMNLQSQSAIDETGERHFEAEKLLAKRQRDGEAEYLVRWKGLSTEDDSWERGLMTNCPDLIQEFEHAATIAQQDATSTSPAQSGVRQFRTNPDQDSMEDQSPAVRRSPSKRAQATGKQGPAGSPAKAKSRKSPKKTAASDTPVTKTKTSSTEGLDRSLIGTGVSFAPAMERWMKPDEYKGIGSAYLTGIVRDYKYSKKVGKYEIRWVNSYFQSVVAKVDLATVLRGRENFKRVREDSSTQPRWTHLLKSTKKTTIQIADDLEDLVDYEFSLRQEVPATLSDVERVLDVTFDPERVRRQPKNLFAHSDGSTVTRMKPDMKHIFQHSASASFFAYIPVSFWRQVLVETNGQLEDTIASKRAEASSESSSASKVRSIAPFTMDELMKFLGILWFMTMVDKGEYANYWGEQVEDAIFDAPRASLDKVMTLRRFRDLRSAFSCRRSSSVTAADLQSDSAVRIRPLLNILKLTASKYVEVGRDIAVDEATIAARSKYARHIIAFNPRKPTGKYHFKLYMTCCSTTWIALSFRLHCDSTFGDRAEGVHASDSIQSLEKEMEATSVTRQIVLEVTWPFHGSGRIVNCDNYYTSVQLLQALRLKGLFCRGTIKRTSKHFPRHVILGDPNTADKNANKSKAKKSARLSAADADAEEALASEDEADGEELELLFDDPSQPLSAPEQNGPSGDTPTPTNGATQVGTAVVQSTHVSTEVQRGDILQAVSTAHQMLAASWCDGNIVTILSNADASTISNVTRLVQAREVEVPAPTCIKEYNQSMQGVDRNDQFRARFSTANGHSFKKWHKKLAFAIVDIARVNAFLTRKLTLKDSRPERDSHRSFMIELIQELFNGKWMDAPGDDTMLYDDDDLDSVGVRHPNRSSSPSTSARSPAALSPSSRPFTGVPACHDLDSAQVFATKRRRRMCIVCRFEDRRDTVSTVHCIEHQVSLCKRSYVATNTFGCQNSEWSCWDKFHLWYLPRNVFSTTGTVNRSSQVYMEKKNAEMESDVETELRGVHRTLSFDLPAPQTPATPAMSVAFSTPSLLHTPTPSIEF